MLAKAVPWRTGKTDAAARGGAGGLYRALWMRFLIEPVRVRNSVVLSEEGWHTDRHARPTPYAIALEKVATLSFEITPAGAEVFVDQHLVGRSPFPGSVFVEPGTRSITIKLDDRTASTTATVEKGEERTVRLKLPDLKPEPPIAPIKVPAPAAAMPDASGSTVRVPVALGIAAGGVLAAGLGLLIAGNLYHSRAESEALLTQINNRNPPCTTTDGDPFGPCNRILVNLTTSNSLTVVGYGSLVTAGILGVTAVVIALDDRKSTTAITASTRGLSVVGSF